MSLPRISVFAPVLGMLVTVHGSVFVMAALKPSIILTSLIPQCCLFHSVWDLSEWFCTETRTFWYHAMRLWILFKPVLTRLFWHCSCRGRGSSPCFSQMELKAQVPPGHDQVQVKDGVDSSLLLGGVEFPGPCVVSMDTVRDRGAGSWPMGMVHGPFLHPQSHQWLVPSFSGCITLTLKLLPLTSTLKDTADYIGQPRIISLC